MDASISALRCRANWASVSISALRVRSNCAARAALTVAMDAAISASGLCKRRELSGGQRVCFRESCLPYRWNCKSG